MATGKYNTQLVIGSKVLLPGFFYVASFQARSSSASRCVSRFSFSSSSQCSLPSRMLRDSTKLRSSSSPTSLSWAENCQRMGGDQTRGQNWFTPANPIQPTKPSDALRKTHSTRARLWRRSYWEVNQTCRQFWMESSCIWTDPYLFLKTFHQASPSQSMGWRSHGAVLKRSHQRWG